LATRKRLHNPYQLFQLHEKPKESVILLSLRSAIGFPPVGAAEGCDLLIFAFKSKIKRSQPSAAPTGDRARQDSLESAGQAIRAPKY
jgi:hypothetical protein